MSSVVESIKERLSVADVIGSYLTLEKAGRNFKARCPFHNEKTPSFFVSPDRGSYYCFGCGVKGDIFTFVQEYEGVDFRSALKQLASKAGVELVREDPQERSAERRLYDLMDAATAFYEGNLMKASAAYTYLVSRGLLEETVRAWRLGFAPDEWRLGSGHLMQKGFTEGELLRAGLTKEADEKKSIYDRFRNRVMFPITDASGRVIAFSGRILGKETEGAPKYLNSPETPIFTKSNVLYGFDKAKQEIRRLDYAILVEGQMDLVMSHQSGFRNTVASSGTALTEHQLSLIGRLSKRLMMVYDADSAGVSASLRSASLALAAGFDVKVAALPTGMDPAELLKTDPKQYRDCLSKARHIIEFYLDVLVKTSSDVRTLGKLIREKLLPFLASLTSSIERAHFVALISKATGIKEIAILEDLKSVKGIVPPTVTGAARPREVEKGPRKDFIQRLLFGVLFWQEGLKEEQVVSGIVSRARNIIGDEFSDVEKNYRAQAHELAFQAESYYGTKDITSALDELFSALEEDALREQLAIAMRALAAAEGKKDAGEVKRLLSVCQELSKKIAALKAV